MPATRQIFASQSTWLFALLTLVLMPIAGTAQQQPGPGLPNPVLRTVMPMGGKAGSTFEITLTGQDFDDPQSLLFSEPGIKAELLATPPPDSKKPAGPMPVRFKVTIAADTPVGIHDIRLVTKLGVSNPRAFVVGDLNEVLEKEPNNDVDQAQLVSLETTINGVISTPTDVDYYAFKGRKGQRVVVSCLTSSIDSRLPVGLELYRRTGGPLASNRDYHEGDAVLDCILPDDDDYFVRVFGFAYRRGGPDYFYRLTISTAPWIDAIFPPIIEPGKPTEVSVYGRNLPGGKPDRTATLIDGTVLERISVTINPPADRIALHRLAYTGRIAPRSSALDGFEYRLKNDSGWSNPYLLTFASAAVVLDNEDNDTADKAQAVNLPCDIAGRIEKKGDRDWYSFTAKKGIYSIEAYGDRLGSPLDLYFSVRQGRDKNGTEVDDNPEILHQTQFFTRTKDPPRFVLVAPADGAYLLQISSREAEVVAGPRQLYHVRITPEQPDFTLIVMPGAPTLPDAAVVRPGSSQLYTVLVWRQDGFNGEIALSADGLPKGVTCRPQQFIAAGQKQGTLVLTAAPDAEPWAGAIHVRGTATIKGIKAEREARAATITWPVPQMNIPAIARVDRDLALAVRPGMPFHIAATADRTTIHAGDKVQVKVKIDQRAKDMKVPLQLSVLNLVPNLITGPNTNQPIQLAADKDEATLTLDVKANAPPGMYTLVIRSQATVQLNRDAANGNKQKQNSVVVQPSEPITLIVLPRQLATISVNPNVLAVKQGGDAEAVVKVVRQFDYTGPFTLQLVVPDGVKGISAEEVTIPDGKDEAKLVIKTAADAPAGNHAGLVIRSTGQWRDQAITQEVKLSVNVSK